jgi:hypothetical protein
MFIALAAILLLAWVFGFAVFNVASMAVHVLLLAAVVSIFVHFIRHPRIN